MNRKLLESHGVFYEENPGSVSDLPSHVDYLRSALLDFDFTISHRFNLCEDITDMREFNLNDAFHKMNINDGEQKTVRASIERYKEIQETAFFLTEAASIEYKWQKLFADFFFDPLRKAAAPLNGDSRR